MDSVSFRVSLLGNSMVLVKMIAMSEAGPTTLQTTELSLEEASSLHRELNAIFSSVEDDGVVDR